MNTAKRLSKKIKTAQRSLQHFSSMTKSCTRSSRHSLSRLLQVNFIGSLLLAFFLSALTLQTTHAGQQTSFLNTLTTSTPNQLPPIVSLDKQQRLLVATGFMQAWQHDKTQPSAKQWLSFNQQDWKKTTQSNTKTQHQYFRLTLFNNTNEELQYTYQSHASSNKNINVELIARASLNQLNDFHVTYIGLQVAEVPRSKIARFTLQAEQVVILAISSTDTFSGNPASILQSQKDSNQEKSKTDRLSLFLSGVLLSLLFLCIINMLATRKYISVISFIFSLTATLTHGAIKSIIFLPVLQSSTFKVVIFTTEILSLTALIALINWVLVSTQHSRSINKKYFYAAPLLTLAAALTAPNFLQELSLALKLCVSFICFYFVLLSYFKNPQRIDTLLITFINATAVIIQLWLNQQYLDGLISADRQMFFSMIASAINISSVLTLLLYIIREQQAFLSDKMRDAIKQEQKIATLSPLIHASRHDLRAPLSDIIGLAELISDHPLDQQQRKSIYSIQSVAKNALSNINRIFSYQSNTQSTLTPYRQKSTFYLTDLISECTNFYGHYFSESEQELIIDLAENLPNHIVGEHELLRQIFMHIIEYLAIHIGHTDACINIQFDEKKGLLIQHTLANKPLKKHNNLPNQLQLIKTLSKKISGRFYINNTRQQISLTLPMEVVESVDQSSDIHLLTTGKRILVVDDNPTSCNVISAYLKRWGIKVYTANDLSEAQAIVRHQKTLNHSIDLAIVDYLLTNATGLDLVNKLLEDPKINFLMPIIIMSNAPDLIDTTQAKNFGIRHILEKPVLAETLKALVLEEFHLQQTLRIDIEDNNQQAKPFNKRFLLVEDNPISAKILTAMLDKLSINYDHAQTAAEALSLFYKHHYSLILLDCELPDDTGFSVTKKMRSHQASISDHTVIIALSADNSDEYKARARQAGMNEFIAKPLSLEHLNALIKKYEA